jgi:hypothetical protein
MIRIDFEHRQSSHCESGVTANLLSHYGIHISEAMAFGIGGGLFFAYMPFIRVNKLPLTTYRCEVGGILKRVTKALGCEVHWRKFKDPQSAMAVLDELLGRGIPVGCRTGAYWLPYFPPAFRFHFNMHNLVVFGKEEGEYLISDPVFPEAVRCAPEALMKARFAQGPLAPNGVMYHITQVPRAVDLVPAIKKGIKMVCRRMLKTPLPVAGVRGIGFLADRLEKWPAKLGAHNAALHVGQLIRMQEEIGTGGAGFRFMYAAFLQEAAPLLEKTNLLELSRQMTETGDLWRKLAVIGARICKDRASEMDTFAAMADLLRECATRETLIYQELMESI